MKARTYGFQCTYSWQSLTKFYDGHNVTLGGAVASATKELDERLHYYCNIHGKIIRFVESSLRILVTIVPFLL